MLKTTNGSYTFAVSEAPIYVELNKTFIGIKSNGEFISDLSNLSGITTLRLVVALDKTQYGTNKIALGYVGYINENVITVDMNTICFDNFTNDSFSVEFNVPFANFDKVKVFLFDNFYNANLLKDVYKLVIIRK